MYAIAKTENHQINTNLTLHDSSQSPLTVRAVTLSLTKQDNELIECRLTFCVNPQLYNHIDTNALFNLKPDARNPLSSGTFLPEPDITIVTSLKPDLLPLLAEHAIKIDETAKYILNLSQEQPDNQILFTESWLGLSVKQQQESGEIGYRTLWSYISPADIAIASTNSEGISDAIVNFFKDWTEANLSAKNQKATSEMLSGISHILTQLTNINMDEMTQEIEANIPPSPTGGQIFEEMVNFFKADDWPIVQIPGQPALQMAFQGENGKWTCYARTRVEQQQFVFYSICPVNAPEDKQLDIAEYLTRANCGMMIGNFELDFADGEISYKTSIDVEGDRLSSALIRRLVYANVTMMDQYLPGIMSVIYGNVSPEDAIARIES
ncbi:MAG: YbjN domain-containing protein [Stigonema ocellatum SAG 48.90 = DSM 106950]|nr:YbjN domain-containing protein [Stigonema ocellatum SAG 48.90 = DSM 106950]